MKMFKIKKIHKYILIGFIIIVAVLWTVSNLKCRVIIKNDILLGIKDGIIEKRADIKIIEIPDGVTAINFFAFKDCSNLESVGIPGSVRSIGVCAFYNCVKLSSISLPEQLETIET